MVMINAAQGSRTQLLFKEQSVLGTVATGDFTRLRYSTHSLDVSKQTAESDEMRQDREVQDYRHGNQNALGDIASPLIFFDHDPLIESAMFSDWGTDNISIGTTMKPFSIEDGAVDISRYRMYQDMVVNTWTIAMGPSQPIIRSTFGLIGTTSGLPLPTSSGGTPISSTENEPFDSFSGSLFDNVEESGSELATISSLTFNINNGIQPGFALGQKTPVVLEYGKGRVTGQFVAYYTDAVLINRFLNETEGSLVVNVVDPDSNTMEFRFPRIKYNGAPAPVASEQSRLITIPFIALRDSNLGTAFRVSKV